MSYQPPQPPSGGGYDPNQAARGEGGYDPNPTTPIGDYNQPPAGGYQQPPQQGGYGAPQGGYDPQQGGYQQPQQGGYPPQQGGYPPQQGGYNPQQGGYNPQQAGYGTPPPGGPGYYGAPPQPARTSPLAIISMIVGILSIPACCFSWLGLIVSIAALVLYFVARGQINSGMGGKGLATTGLITGIIGLALSLVAIAITVFLPNSELYRGLMMTATAIANP